MDLVNITIDGEQVKVPKESTVLEAVRGIGIKIPTLCYHPEFRPEGSCRICLVEVAGARSLVASCVYPVNEGMVVRTNTPEVREARKAVVELLLANHPEECLSCQRNLNCELQKIAADCGIRKVRFDGEKKNYPADAANPALVRDQNKCVLCGRCIRACSERQGVHVYSFANRGFNTTVVPAFNAGLHEAACTFCGQCANVCPTAAIVEKDDTKEVWEALHDPKKHVVVQTAPAVRVALGEGLGIASGSIVTGQMVAALRRLGFDRVFDTVFSADVTIMEEGSEFIERLTKNGPLPMITSCSPGWVNYVELMYPDLLAHLSTTKSPQQIFGVLVKTYYAERVKLDPQDIISVSIMPCTAKKVEAGREEMKASGYQDVDYVLTTRELVRMIKEAGIDFSNLKSEEFDAPLGISSGAGVIFGATGGVMEAALRTVSEVLTGKPLECVDFHNVRGLSGMKEAEVHIGDKTVKVAVAHTLANARIILDKIRNGEADYHFIEIMACPGGCIGGGGQPISTSPDIREQRMAAIYECDKCAVIRKAHENPAVRELYDTWLKTPLGEKSHHLLHTHYHAQVRK
ncbi:NADH-dependent [FeFe] hydrogenase, group A6 [Sporomusa malonica]|uniref:NAD(P)-dependent iron-only hydrogenase catalytic subunit n=1 Tax=Sporomusa malonica TaxID=112901 RepID=A0A1W2EHK2_9FIRM|nr:NADH-dependent [FeFe] hydrogenase, group A6 [Sporomusa malonica]SMD08806.1 NAD(P)-dependent iron-only hydrogenase catalytic subunit [Sporomusa malonica]